jgi:hypothetical protein
VSDRKYRQHGYMDRDKPAAEKREQPRPTNDLGGPRTPQMPGKRSLSRCAQCGTILPATADPGGQCPKCGAALHCCKQCTYFDPGSRFECRQPIPERIARKDAANNCTFYLMKVTVERETSSGAVRVDDARKAFDNLFKK